VRNVVVGAALVGTLSFTVLRRTSDQGTVGGAARGSGEPPGAARPVPSVDPDAFFTPKRSLPVSGRHSSWWSGSSGITGRSSCSRTNFWVKQTGNPPSTRDPVADSGQVLRTYQAMYRAAYDGNRAPLILGNHFNSWNGNAYSMALATFVTETCHQPDTYCVPYRDVIRWMQTQDPAVLAGLQSQPAVDTVG
jgi:hypothetical protein